jgi:eukaryotic-like serine/threonine-protein kinase
MRTLEPLRSSDPRSLGGYRLRFRIGGGGMGVVYLGVSRAGHRVAVKLIRAEFSDDDQFRARFRREVEAARRVSGRYTARILAADVDAERPWLATEYVPGLDLEAVVAAARLDHDQQVALAVGLAEALRAIHSVAVIHRDFKPTNVLCSREGPKVIDFGIAAALGATAITRTGWALGSPGWMAPEQLSGGPVTPAIDVFAWAALLVFAATGRPPFAMSDPRGTALAVLHREPALGPPDQLASSLRSVIDAAFSKNPAERPTTGELLAALTGNGEATAESPDAVPTMVNRLWSLPATALLNDGYGDLPKTPRRLRRRSVALVVAGILGGAAIAGGLTWQLSGREASSGRASGSQEPGPPTGTASGSMPSVSDSADSAEPSAKQSPTPTQPSDVFATLPRLRSVLPYELPKRQDDLTPFLTTHEGRIVRLDVRITDLPFQSEADAGTPALAYTSCSDAPFCGGTEFLVRGADVEDSHVYWDSGEWIFSGYFLVTAVAGPGTGGVMSANLKPLSAEQVINASN